MKLKAEAGVEMGPQSKFSRPQDLVYFTHRPTSNFRLLQAWPATGG